MCIRDRDDVIGLSTIYMRIYFCGMPFFMLYNYGAAILRAVGDTKDVYKRQLSDIRVYVKSKF